MANWTREELLAAFGLYMDTPFGRFHTGNQEIVELANRIGRTPSAVSMKLCNFASFDPANIERGVKGLQNVSRADRDLWDEFNDVKRKDGFSIECQQVYEHISGKEPTEMPLSELDLIIPLGPTQKQAMQNIRLQQRFFRNSVLTSYQYRCAICGIHVHSLLSASHIIPWSKNEERRVDPTNGLSLCALHDRSFDRGFWTLNENFQVVLSQRLRAEPIVDLQRAAFLDIEGQAIKMPTRFLPDPIAIDYHREHIFR